MAGTGPLLPKAKKYASDLGIIEELCFLGFINHNDVMSIIKDAYVIINSVPVHSAGKITLESFALKKPVVRAMAMDTYLVIDGNTRLIYNSSSQ